MSTGPATKMYAALTRVARETSTWPECAGYCKRAAAEACENLTPTTLEAMDAAAEVIARHKPVDPILVQEMPSFGDADFCLWGVTVRLSVEEEAELLRILLERRISSRKEPGNG